MDYKQVIDYIHGTKKFGSKLGLHNITKLLELMGNPQKELKFVHVAGTNGKGSITAFISSILMESGYRVGIYTSPYLERFTERIKVGNQEISEDELSRVTTFVRDKVDTMVGLGFNHPTEFEIVTAIAFQYYYEKRCDIIVLEVGLGGRLDATNVIDAPELAVIATISLDHTEWLGNTLAEIALEKAGIIKANCDVVLYPQTSEVEAVFADVCKERGARLYKADFTGVNIKQFGINGQNFDYNDDTSSSKDFKQMKSIDITLLGEHQVKNAVAAIKSAEILAGKGYAITEASLRKGLKNTKWPGRLEVLSRDPVFIIDGAHNPEGIKVFADTLCNYFPEKRRIFIMGVLKDKDYLSMVKTIAPLGEQFIAVAPLIERAMPARDLAEIISNYCKNVTFSDTIEQAVMTSLRLAESDHLVCALGSLYFIGDVRKQFVV